MDQEKYYLTMVHNPWIIGIIQNLGQQRYLDTSNIGLDSFVYDGTTLFLTIDSGSMINIFKEPRYGVVCKVIVFLHSLIYADALTEVEGYTKFVGSSVFNDYLKQWLFQQYLFYKVQGKITTKK
jgi:hypothetical protein